MDVRTRRGRFWVVVGRLAADGRLARGEDVRVGSNAGRSGFPVVVVLEVRIGGRLGLSEGETGGGEERGFHPGEVQLPTVSAIPDEARLEHEGERDLLLCGGQPSPPAGQQSRSRLAALPTRGPDRLGRLMLLVASLDVAHVPHLLTLDDRLVLVELV